MLNRRRRSACLSTFYRGLPRDSAPPWRRPVPRASRLDPRRLRGATPAMVWCHRSSANRTQEETVSASDRPGVLFRAGTSQSNGSWWRGRVCCRAARALRLEGGEPLSPTRRPGDDRSFVSAESRPAPAGGRSRPRRCGVDAVAGVLAADGVCGVVRGGPRVRQPGVFGVGRGRDRPLVHASEEPRLVRREPRGWR